MKTSKELLGLAISELSEEEIVRQKNKYKEEIKMIETFKTEVSNKIDKLKQELSLETEKLELLLTAYENYKNNPDIDLFLNELFKNEKDITDKILLFKQSKGTMVWGTAGLVIGGTNLNGTVTFYGGTSGIGTNGLKLTSF